MLAKKIAFTVILVATMGFATFMALPSQVPQDIDTATITPRAEDVPAEQEFVPLADGTEEILPIDTAASSFEFEGFAFDGKKSHVGTFDEYEGTVTLVNGQVVGMEGTVNAASVNTGIDGLDSHLQSDDFFDVERFPVIAFTSTAVTQDSMTGDFTMHGITNEISFPITREENSVSAQFLLDTTPFELKYTGINKDVAVTFEFSA